MALTPHRPAQLTLSLWLNAPFEVALHLKAGAPLTPVDLGPAVLGVTFTGLEGGAELTLRTDDAPASGASALQIVDAALGQVSLIVSAADAARVTVGRDGQWRLWLLSEGGEAPLIFGTIEGKDFA